MSTPVFDSPEERDRVERVFWSHELMKFLQTIDGPPGVKLYAAALAGVFTRGGSLEQYLRLNPKRGSHRTPKWIVENLTPHRDDGEKE